MKLTIGLVGVLAVAAIPAMAQTPTQPDMQKAMAAMQQALGAMQQQGGAKPVVDYHELKALLPKELSGGMKGQLKGQKSGAMGMTISEAEGSYSDENSDHNITMKISDISGTGAFGAMAHAAWATADIDNESDTGYEKTTTISGYKGMEKYDTKSKNGELHVIVDSRFIVEVRGSNVKMDDMKAALGKVDLKKLAGLKAPAAAAPTAP